LLAAPARYVLQRALLLLQHAVRRACCNTLYCFTCCDTLYCFTCCNTLYCFTYCNTLYCFTCCGYPDTGRFGAVVCNALFFLLASTRFFLLAAQKKKVQQAALVFACCNAHFCFCCNTRDDVLQLAY
jgi:hypothetical protein